MRYKTRKYQIFSPSQLNLITYKVYISKFWGEKVRIMRQMWNCEKKSQLWNKKSQFPFYFYSMAETSFHINDEYKKEKKHHTWNHWSLSSKSHYTTLKSRLRITHLHITNCALNGEYFVFYFALDTKWVRSAIMVPHITNVKKKFF